MTIKECRQATGLTQQQFAKLFDISLDTVKSWDCGRRRPTAFQEKMITRELERMISNNMEEMLKKELLKRNIEIDSEINYAGNGLRYFIYKGQKIYFDSQKINGGTYFGWDEEKIKNLLFVMENIDYGKEIYYNCPIGMELDFAWGKKEQLVDVDFLGCWHEVDGKICKEI